MSTLVQAEIVNVVVLVAVLQADVGRARTVTVWRLVRPVIIAAAIVPVFISPLTGHGGGLAVELGGVAAGVVLGALALTLIHVRREDGQKHALTSAGWPYALFWVVVIGARAVFSYGSEHLFQDQLREWLQTTAISPDAITDGLILMAVALILVRTGGLALRARRVSATPHAGAAVDRVPGRG